jgi:heme/copper-type cytochrome/quinol oxidase subunit 3
MSSIRAGMLLFIGSESVFFVLLILAYVVYHTTSASGAEAARFLDVGKTSVFTVALFSSSLTMWRSGVNFRRARRRAALSWLLATIVLGGVFLVGQGSEYAHLIGENVTISRDLFGTTFFTLTGFHGLHVFIGLIILTTYFFIELRSDLPHRPEAVEAVSIYWHFVDAVWVVIFPTVYLWVMR